MGDFLIHIKKVIYSNEPSLKIDYCGNCSVKVPLSQIIM
jgi:hypothetical protein